MRKSVIYGILSFLLVLVLMPLGHTLMILIEKFFNNYKFLGAGIIGFIGLFMLIIAFIKQNNKVFSTIFGFLAAILIWTGWIEFSFVWIAEKNQVSPLMSNGEISTKPEYLVMMSSVGLLSVFLIYYLFIKTKCTFFTFFQNLLKISNKQVPNQSHIPKPIAVFMETIFIIWTFYLVLLMVYDENIAGEKHFLTYVVAYGSLIWSIILFSKLVKFSTFDYSIRYAIPTVVIFWNFIEVLGRWGLLKEIWIEPSKYKFEMSLMFLILIIFLSIIFFNKYFLKKTSNA